MGNIFDRYIRFNQTKGGNHANLKTTSATVRIYKTASVAVVLDDSPPDLEVEIRTPVESRISLDNHPEHVKARIRMLQEQEAHLRNQREKYRMNYYRLERESAPKSDFQKNYAIIADLTRQLAPVYMERKKIELSGTIETKVEPTSDQLNRAAQLKLEKDRLIDKKSKLKSKIANHLAFANGPKNLPRWELELANVNLDIYAKEEEIKRILG